MIREYLEQKYFQMVSKLKIYFGLSIIMFVVFGLAIFIYSFTDSIINFSSGIGCRYGRTDMGLDNNFRVFTSVENIFVNMFYGTGSEQGVLKKARDSIIKNYKFQAIKVLCLIMFITIVGWSFFLGSVNMNLKDMAFLVLKISVLTYLTDPSSIWLFDTLIIPSTLDIMNSVSSFFVNSIVLNLFEQNTFQSGYGELGIFLSQIKKSTSPLLFFDAISGIAFSEVFWFKMISTYAATMGIATPLILLTYGVMIYIIFLSARVVVYLVIAKITIALAFILMPIMLLLFFVPYTKKYTEDFIEDFIIEPIVGYILMSAFCSLALYFVIQEAAPLLDFEACKSGINVLASAAFGSSSIGNSIAISGAFLAGGLLLLSILGFFGLFFIFILFIIAVPFAGNGYDILKYCKSLFLLYLYAYFISETLPVIQEMADKLSNAFNLTTKTGPRDSAKIEKPSALSKITKDFQDFADKNFSYSGAERSLFGERGFKKDQKTGEMKPFFNKGIFGEKISREYHDNGGFLSIIKNSGLGFAESFSRDIGATKAQSVFSRTSQFTSPSGLNSGNGLFSSFQHKDNMKDIYDKIKKDFEKKGGYDIQKYDARSETVNKTETVKADFADGDLIRKTFVKQLYAAGFLSEKEKNEALHPSFGKENNLSKANQYFKFFDNKDEYFKDLDKAKEVQSEYMRSIKSDQQVEHKQLTKEEASRKRKETIERKRQENATEALKEFNETIEKAKRYSSLANEIKNLEANKKDKNALSTFEKKYEEEAMRSARFNMEPFEIVKNSLSNSLPPQEADLLKRSLDIFSETKSLSAQKNELMEQYNQIKAFKNEQEKQNANNKISKIEQEIQKNQELIAKTNESVARSIRGIADTNPAVKSLADDIASGKMSFSEAQAKASDAYNRALDEFRSDMNTIRVSSGKLKS